MGLIRGVARTAVVAGTATATANAVNRREMRRHPDAYGEAPAEAPPEYSQQPQPAQAQAPAAQASGGTDDKLDQLQRLGQLKAQGVLTEQEFQQQKAVILGSGQ